MPDIKVKNVRAKGQVTIIFKMFYEYFKDLPTVLDKCIPNRLYFCGGFFELIISNFKSFYNPQDA